MSIITEFGKTVRSRIAGGRSDAPQSHTTAESPALVPVPAEPPKKRQRSSVKLNAGSDNRLPVDATRQTGALADQGTLATYAFPELMSKSDTVLHLLRRTDGVTVLDLMSATSWQRHSVRGFLSGTVRKKLGLTLISNITDGGERRYRIPPDVDGVGCAPAGVTVPSGPPSISGSVDKPTDTAVC